MTAGHEAPELTDQPAVALGGRLRDHPAPDVLVLGRATLAGLGSRLSGLAIKVHDDAGAFLAALVNNRPRVVVVSAPPAAASTIDAVAAVRRRRPTMRAVLLDAETAVEERLRALKIGFDAALTDAIPGDELAGRLLLLSRHPRSVRERLSICEGTVLDTAARTLLRDGRSIHLRPKEFRLLEVLARHPGRIHSRSQLLDQVWGPGRAGDPRTVDVHVRWLRAKVEPDPRKPVHLLTVRGLGYRLDPDGP